MLLIAALPGCGKRGDPLPPLRIVPQQVTELRLSQRGEQLETSFVAPRASADGRGLGVFEVELQRMTGDGDFEKLAARSTLRVAPGETIEKSEALPAPGTVVRIAARASAKGRTSNRTPIVTLIVQPPPLAPQQLTAQLTPTGLALRWVDPNPIPTPSPTPEATPTPLATPTIQPPPTPAPASPTPTTSPAASPSPSAAPTPKPTPTPPPPPVRGIWIYRRAKDGAYTRPLQDEVLTSAEYEDRSVLPGEEWCYVVRFLASKLPLVESASSNEACAGFKDIAAPAAPIGVAVVLRTDGIEVSWSPSPDTDLAGYRVYRAAPPGEPPALVAEVPAQQTSIKDVASRAGVVNVYTVRALDKAGNESAPSAPVQVRP